MKKAPFDRQVAERVKLGAMVSGGALQVPIYALISGLPVELLGVGPNHDPQDDVVRFDGFGSADERNGVLETLRVVATLAKSGCFPLRRGDHCEWCDFRSAWSFDSPPFATKRTARVSSSASNHGPCTLHTTTTIPEFFPKFVRFMC
jgi:hypothetical protein